MALRKVLPYVVLVALAATPLVAQTAPATSAQPQPAVAAAVEGGTPQYIKPETEEQRRSRLGTVDDPGPNPDPEKIWWRFGKQYKIHRYERRWAKYDQQEGWVRPFAPVNFAKEIYQQNEQFVWVWHEIIDTTKLEDSSYTPPPDDEIRYFESVRTEFSELAPPTSNVRVKFEEASNGLPGSGSWRNSLAVGDMNEDGFPDLVLPPQRGAENTPSIFLGDGKGNWKLWDILWPSGFNYGGVTIADFNKDKHLDLAFAIHLTGVAVFLGDGKGKFTASSEGLPMDFPSRRVIASDVNADGWMDVVAISEGPMVRGPEIKPTVGGNLRAYVNKKKGMAWEQIDIAPLGKYLGGDWLVAANLNGDKYPDFVGASIYFNGVDTMWISNNEARSWRENTDRAVVPFLSYYSANTAGRFNEASKTDEVIVSYFRQWPDHVNPKTVPPPPLRIVIGIDKITFSGKEPKRTSIARWSSTRSVWGMGRGDFDGDGNLDVAYTLFDPREVALLVGDGAGKFKRATVEGIKLPGMINYDLTVADVNKDSKPDLIVMYESDETSAFGSKNGKVQVFLNRGTVAAGTP
jgi:FG-GAP-like repeat